MNQKIEARISELADKPYQRYSVEAMLRIILEIKSCYGTKEEAQKFKELYRKLIVNAKDLYAIMDHVRENPQSIETYVGMPKARFKDEVIEIYQNYIKGAAACPKLTGLSGRFQND